MFCMSKCKSRDLNKDRARCADYECPKWRSGCARAETQLGAGRFTWLRVDRRKKNKTSCRMQIDPVTFKGRDD